MSQPALTVVPTPADVSAAAAAFIVDRLGEAIAARGVAHWCTTGGSSAPGIYRALCAAPLRDQIDWSWVHTWWGDDRFVPAGEALSNVTPFNDIMLSPDGGLPIPDANIHTITRAMSLGYKDQTPAWLAEAYEGNIRHAWVHPPVVDGLPVFDLIILGVGPDGHILSCFPGSAVFDSSAWVESVPAPTHIEPHVPRVTINPSLVTAARSVLVATTGGAKAELLARVWAGGDPRELPLRTTLIPTATWLLDEAAAADLR
jgi:6-phosphogluconolactonase